jgi:hypothetical protein
MDAVSQPKAVCPRIPSILELLLPDSDAKLFPDALQVLQIPLKPPAVRGSWTPDEDETLIRLLSEQPHPSWNAISSRIGTHTAKQCRERWLVKLNPDVRRSPFEKWEDVLIQTERQRIGNQWSLIAQLLPGRTACSVKNRWYTVLRFQPSRIPHWT